MSSTSLNPERVGIADEIIDRRDTIIILDDLWATLKEAICFNTALAPLRPFGNAQPVVIGIERARE
jgi:hypothetical protein